MRRLETFLRIGLPAILLLMGGAAGRTTAAESSVPWLGVMMQELTDELRDGMDYRGEGVLVSGVVEGSPAVKAGVRKGDVVVSVNNRPVDSPDKLSDVIREARVGQTVSVVVMRGGQRRALSVRLASRPDDVGIDVPDMSEIPDLERLHELDIEAMPRMPLGEHGDMFSLHGMGRGRLGVRVEDLSKDLAPYFDASEGAGALVLEVMKETPAEKAGIRAGDIITHVGGDKITGADDLVSLLRRASKGKTSVTVTRKGVKRIVEAELGEAPRAWRSRDGRDFMVMGPQDRRLMIRRSGPAAPRAPQGKNDELRELREELRQLREKLEKLENR